MPKLNQNYQNLKESYLFSEIAHRVADYALANPDKKIIRLGIGDVTMPLGSHIIQGLHLGVDAMASPDTFKGYGPEQGYDFLRNAISAYYAKNGISVDAGDIFVSDGAKSDTGNISELFDMDNVILIPDPVYPVYVDSNLMSGKKITYLSGDADNQFLPMPDKNIHADIIYLCSPNNPTGAAATYDQLKTWVDYANAHGSVILFDSAYEAFISEEGVPHSIFEVEGAKTCAIEFRSFSKSAGFTGTRCAYTVIPKALERDGASLNALWSRRQGTKFNGVSYVVQRAAEAALSPEGRVQTKAAINYYLNNARVVREGLSAAGLTVYGGVNAPYLWVRTPNNTPSWDFFDLLLKRACVVTTPGAGFGPSGEGYIRVTAFGDADATKEAVRRIVSVL